MDKPERRLIRVREDAEIVTASANYAHDLVSEALDNEYAQEELTPLAAAEAVGLTAGAMRLPLQPLDGAQRAAVNALVS